MSAQLKVLQSREPHREPESAARSGITEKKQKLEYSVGPDRSLHTGRYVGWIQQAQELDKHFFVKALIDHEVEGQHQYIMSSIRGYTYEYALLSESELREVMSGGEMAAHTRRGLSGAGAMLNHTFAGDNSVGLVATIFGVASSLKVAELFRSCSCNRLQQLMRESFPGMSMKQLIELADTNHDGRVSIEEFVAICSKSSADSCTL